MPAPREGRLDLRVAAGGAGLTLTSRRAAEQDPALLDPSASRPWAELEERGEAIAIPQISPSVRLVVGELDWGDFDGLVDRATWKLGLADGALVLGGVDEGRQDVALEPGRYWVTLYSFAGPDRADETVLHLQQVEDDGDFLRTSLGWMPEPTQDEPLVMGAEDTEELLALVEGEEDEISTESLNLLGS